MRTRDPALGFRLDAVSRRRAYWRLIDRSDADSAVRLADTITWPVSMTSVSVYSRLRGTLADGLKLTPFT